MRRLEKRLSQFWRNFYFVLSIFASFNLIFLEPKMVSFSDDDINTLTDEVQSHNHIWNFQNDDHRKRKEVDKAFEEIAKKMSDEKRTIAGELFLKCI
jgi:hypothetical protein